MSLSLLSLFTRCRCSLVVLNFSMATTTVDFVVVGGGVAGVSCAEELYRVTTTESICLLSASSVLKGVRSTLQLDPCDTRYLSQRAIHRPCCADHELCEDHGQLRVV